MQRPLHSGHRGVSLRNGGYRIDLCRLVGGWVQWNRAVRDHSKRGNHRHGDVQQSIYVITATVNGTGGAISPSGSVIREVSGGSKTFTITPKTGYRIADVMVDGKSVGVVTKYTFSNVAANHTIVASFIPNIVTYTIIAAVNGKGGVISPSGNVSISNAGTKTFLVTPKTGYRIAGVTVNGKSVGALTKYTFSNVTANQSITATFRRWRW